MNPAPDNRPTAEQTILILNAGSSSLRFASFQRSKVSLVPRCTGKIDRIGSHEANFTFSQSEQGATESMPIKAANHVLALDPLFDRLSKATNVCFSAIGHRVVHGGPRYFEPRQVNAEMIDALNRFRQFAPEHLPAQIDLIDAVGKRFPHTPQVACFDTAFHQNLPKVARTLPIPRRYQDAGIRRYGFHGLSYQFLLEELTRIAGPAKGMGRVIFAHLGSGASMAAVKNGECMDTSMSFTPAAGLMMGRRSGDLDPGLPVYFARTENMSAEDFNRMVNYESGMLGVSEISSDMRELLAREQSDNRAAEAVGLFCYQAKKWVGSFSAVLGGIDTLVFAGGIGEYNAMIRKRVCDGLGFLGIDLDEARNAKNMPLISSDSSRVEVRVIHTDEELMIAKSVQKILQL